MKAAFFLLSTFVVSCLPTYSQDPGIDAANQAAQLANMAAQQMQQQQIQTMNTINLINLQNAANLFDFPESSGPVIGSAIQPTFSVKPGKVDPGTVVRLQTVTHYATIYYTTDGWSPTASSKRYTGPITIDADAHFQALAVGPNLLHSPLARADYWTAAPSKASSATSTQQPALITDGVLRAGTRLHLTTTTEISSKAAQVGDKVPLQLDQDVKIGDMIVAAKGTPVEAILTVADPAGKHGVPGDLVFRVHALSIQGKTVPLNGGQNLEGAASARNPREAVIEPGMTVIITVAVDTSLKP